MDQRVPTFLFSIDGVPSPEASVQLAGSGYGVWSHDTYYALELYPRLGYDEALRLGFIHYNTEAEVDGVLAAISDLARPAPTARRIRDDPASRPGPSSALDLLHFDSRS
jgi:selenocysteine lyase/cysteine desulfurase